MPRVAHRANDQESEHVTRNKLNKCANDVYVALFTSLCV